MPDPARPLPDDFLSVPVAHRGLHDAEAGRIENSCAAVAAAVAEGFGIEIDLQPSADGAAMVFHDYTLDRLTDRTGPIRTRTAAELGGIGLTGNTDPEGAGIPTLAQVLDLVAGRVPLLIEVKDQSGDLGPQGIGPLEDATAEALRDYRGPLAVMSFNPDSVAALAQALPDVPRGLTCDAFDEDDWAAVPAARRRRLAGIGDFDRTGACFVSCGWQALDRAPVRALKARGVPVLCWTIRDSGQEQTARRIADNITFEGYTPAH
ncbi:phosphodiesterase [Rhodobacteraceae bacterium 2CG4]|uniref:Phosphodiesterase n=1 Tax=Halovulum marinum TaxID=2662447 RepID=A0A6L5Z7N2_9RHOB|nr:glycerophosphodiester phosphodiesterase family protein [Halovulum marinum]MSU91952.1 phosphodiesterase [Halovulum marinum]